MSSPLFNQRRRQQSFCNELDANYVDEEHMKAFANALELDDLGTTQDYLETSSPSVYGAPTHNSSGPSSPRIRKISALSDFAPVNLRVKSKRRSRRTHSSDKTRDWLFTLLRWPLLILIFVLIFAEFSLYVIIRQLVNTKEWLMAWRGRKGLLRKKMRASQTYEQWKAVARTLDDYLGFDEWKKVDEDTYYDWKLVRKVKNSLKTLREKKDVHGLLGVLETCIRANFAGTESPRLYSETFYGTKNLVEAYVDEQEQSLLFIRDSPELSAEEKRRFFKTANTNLGVSALCLSGGASFGYYHFGVVKAFYDEGLLPHVIAGTSAGGLVASLLCTRTDEELKSLLVPELANRITACEEPFRLWIKRAWATGARFDSVQMARKTTFFTRGSMTFREAYARTGRILNISVIPADRHSPTKLLNYLTSPDIVIWSALLATAAVPGILNPVVIMEKCRDGTIIPWNWGSKYKDGSLRVDIPVQALNLYFNVTHPIVSQVNPHVHLFFFAPRGSAGKPVARRKGKGWRGNFLLSASEQWLKLELTKNFKVIRDLELLPQLLGQDWSSVFLQRFDGTVTIWPRTRLWDWFRILSDPSPSELERMIQVGQIVTWPKLHMIANRFRLEKQISLGRQAVRRAAKPKGKSRSSEPDRFSSAHGNIISEYPAHLSRGIPEPSPESPLLSEAYDLSMDTDTEAILTHRLLKRTHPRRLVGHVISNVGSSGYRDELTAPPEGRRRTKEIHHDGTNFYPPASPDPPLLSPAATLPSPATQFAGFFKELRTRSLSSLKSPFSSLHFGKGKKPVLEGEANHNDPVTEQAWSGDSSSDGMLSIGGRSQLRPTQLDISLGSSSTYAVNELTGDVGVESEKDYNSY